MFDIPGFDVKSMSDDQLMERSNELSKKLVWASRFSQNGGIEYLQKMLQVINAERSERNFMETWALAAPYLTETIETDPDLKETEQTKEKPSRPDTTVRIRPRMNNVRRNVATPIATKTPVRNIEPNGKTDNE